MGSFCVLRGSITIVILPRALVPMCKYFIKPVPASHILVARSPLAKASHMDKLSQYKRESYKDLNTGKCSLGGPPKWAAERIRWLGYRSEKEELLFTVQLIIQYMCYQILKNK